MRRIFFKRSCTAAAGLLLLLAAGCAQLGIGASPPQAYTVFFQTDDDVIPPEGQKIIQKVAADARSSRPKYIDVLGQASKPGDPKFNQKLSDQRAEAVMKALIADGVPSAIIRTNGFGSNITAASDVMGRVVQIRFEN